MLDTLAHRRMPTGAKGISRRTFFKYAAGALAAGALMVVGDRLPGATWVADPLPPALQRSTFAKYVVQTFQVDRQPSDTIALQLIQVADLPSNSDSATRTLKTDQEHCFSIMFRGRLDQPLAQATYRFEHTQLGSFPLFIVPMASDPRARYYEAIFNCPLG